MPAYLEVAEWEDYASEVIPQNVPKRLLFFKPNDVKVQK